MAITVVPSAVTGQTYSAANYNTQVRDNINGIWVLTTAGDMLYATGASAANRLALVPGGVMYAGASAPAWLAKPAGLGFLQNDAAGVPSWVTGGSAYDVLMKNAANNAYAFGYQRTKFAVVTNSGTQTIPATGSALNILWNTDTFDNDGWHSTSVNTERIIPTVAGEYKASAILQVASTGGAVNAIWIKILKNNTDVIGYFRNTSESGFQVNLSAISIPVSMNGTTDYINATVEHNNGGTLTLSANPYLTVERVR
jgi:hypothetical protein